MTIQRFGFFAVVATDERFERAVVIDPFGVGDAEPDAAERSRLTEQVEFLGFQ